MGTADRRVGSASLDGLGRPARAPTRAGLRAATVIEDALMLLAVMGLAGVLVGLVQVKGFWPGVAMTSAVPLPARWCAASVGAASCVRFQARVQEPHTEEAMQ